MVYLFLFYHTHAYMATGVVYLFLGEHVCMFSCHAHVKQMESFSTGMHTLHWDTKVHAPAGAHMQ